MPTWYDKSKVDSLLGGKADTSALAATIAAAVTAEQERADAAYATLPKPAALASPAWLGHRGGGALTAPDGAIEAMRWASSLGFPALDAGDYRTTVDGGVVCIHDTTLDRTTDLVGNVADTSMAAIINATLDCSTWFGGGWKDTTVPTLTDVLSEFGGKRVLFLEAKDAGSSTGIAGLISRMGIAPSTVVCSFQQSYVAESVAVGAEGMLLVDNGVADPAALLAAGIRYIAALHGTVTLSQVDTLAAAGLKVYIYTTTRQMDTATYDGHNVSGFFSDDPLYCSRNYAAYRKTVAPWVTSGTYYHGHISPTAAIGPTERGIFVGSPGAYRWQQTKDGFVLQGWGSPIANAAGSYTLTVPITFDVLPSDMTRHADIFICQPTDRGFNNVGNSGDNGYNILMRANGTVQIYTTKNGVTTGPVQNVTGVALGTGQVASLKIDVTPTTITVTATINGAVQTPVTLNEATNRGGYFYLGNAGANAGMRCSYGAVTIT